MTIKFIHPIKKYSFENIFPQKDDFIWLRFSDSQKICLQSKPVHANYEQLILKVLFNSYIYIHILSHLCWTLIGIVLVLHLRFIHLWRHNRENVLQSSIYSLISWFIALWTDYVTCSYRRNKYIAMTWLRSSSLWRVYDVAVCTLPTKQNVKFSGVFCLFVWLVVCFESHEQFFSYMATVTITGNKAANLEPYLLKAVSLRASANPDVG
jgi:hypothetical protein